jgi:hypothetical protein
MTNVIKHEAVPGRGSYEVRSPDGGPSRYFYFDDTSPHLNPDKLDSRKALAAAEAFARAEQHKLE